MTSSPARLLPLAAALSISAYAIPAQAYSDDCKPPKTNYSNVSCTSDDNYFVANDDNYQAQALINKQGKVVVSLKGYEGIDQWHVNDSVFAVQKNGKVGYMNTQGKLVVPTIYDVMADPDDKYDETWSEPVENGRILVAKNGKFGIIDTSNKVIMPFTSKYAIVESISEGMAPVMSKAGKWGFINTEGKEVVTPQYDGIDGNFASVYGFAEGLAGMKKGEKWGYITKTGTVAVPFIYDEIRPFSEGLAGVLKGGKWGFINGTNKTMIPFKYSDANVERYSVNYMGANYFTFYEGVAEVATINQKQVCINKSDKKVACRQSELALSEETSS